MFDLLDIFCIIFFSEFYFHFTCIHLIYFIFVRGVRLGKVKMKKTEDAIMTVYRENTVK